MCINTLGMLTLALALMAGSLAAGAAAEEGDWALALDAAYQGKYVWRGVNLVDDPVVQPSVGLSHKSGLSGSIWGNLETTDYNGNSGEFTELDYTVDYSWTWEKLALAAGAIYYDFPNTGADSTTELYASAGLDVLLSPTLTVYRDVDEVEGTYVSLGASYSSAESIEPVPGIVASADFSAAIGHGSSSHNDAYYGHDGVGLTDLLLSASLPVVIKESGWTVTPSVSYSTLLDHKIRDAADDDDNLWAGLTASRSF